MGVLSGEIVLASKLRWRESFGDTGSCERSFDSSTGAAMDAKCGLQAWALVVMTYLVYGGFLPVGVA